MAKKKTEEKPNKEARVTMRLNEDLFEWLKQKAINEGMTYQGLIHRVLTLYKNDRLVDIELAKQLMKTLK